MRAGVACPEPISPHSTLLHSPLSTVELPPLAHHCDSAAGQLQSENLTCGSAKTQKKPSFAATNTSCHSYAPLQSPVTIYFFHLPTRNCKPDFPPATTEWKLFTELTSGYALG
ncbi:hypothetical protein LEMLEM_LOCUS2530 [Lemmus lemmus]